MEADRQAILEAIAYGEEATPADRLKALDLLTQQGGGNPEVMPLVQHVAELSDDQLDQELAGFVDPGFQHTAPTYRQDVEREAKRLAQQYIREGVDEAERVANEGAADEPSTKAEPQPQEGQGSFRQEAQRDQRGTPAVRIDGYGKFHTHVPPGIDPECVRRQWGPPRPPRI